MSQKAVGKGWGASTSKGGYLSKPGVPAKSRTSLLGEAYILQGKLPPRDPTGINKLVSHQQKWCHTFMQKADIRALLALSFSGR